MMSNISFQTTTGSHIVLAFDDSNIKGSKLSEVSAVYDVKISNQFIDVISKKKTEVTQEVFEQLFRLHERYCQNIVPWDCVTNLFQYILPYTKNTPLYEKNFPNLEIKASALTNEIVAQYALAKKDFPFRVIFDEISTIGKYEFVFPLQCYYLHRQNGNKTITFRKEKSEGKFNIDMLFWYPEIIFYLRCMFDKVMTGSTELNYLAEKWKSGLGYHKKKYNDNSHQPATVLDVIMNLGKINYPLASNNTQTIIVGNKFPKLISDGKLNDIIKHLLSGFYPASDSNISKFAAIQNKYCGSCVYCPETSDKNNFEKRPPKMFHLASSLYEINHVPTGSKIVVSPGMVGDVQKKTFDYLIDEKLFPLSSIKYLKYSTTNFQENKNIMEQILVKMFI